MARDSSYSEATWGRTRARRELLIKVGKKLASWRVLRVPNGHYYSPVASLKELRRDGQRVFDRSYRQLPGVDIHEQEQLALLNELAAFYAEQPFPESPKDGTRFFFDNYWYGRSDGLFLYSMIRRFQPQRIVEIGSGFSSAVMLDTNERFMSRRMHLTFIEPDSQRLRQLLRAEDYPTVEILEMPIQRVDTAVVERLAANDILFVDSSHVSKAGSDLNHILFELLPRLAPGVLIHFHDIPYPFEYPRSWFELGVSWNEPYILRAFLQYNSCFSIRFWNDFMMTFHADEIRGLMPLCADPPVFGVGGSLWLQKHA
ncbi:MAG: class I SAM-dependent methyltransferase [Vicinamibacterales bacterium]